VGSEMCIRDRVSTDLIGWAYMDTPQTMAAQGTFSFKSSVYLANANASTTAAFTFTEDTNFIKLPMGAQNAATSAGSWNNFMPFIKVQ
jgi:hypothetical protein